MKLGLGIVAFEATEHLYNIISEIRDLVDYVVVGIQDNNYYGDPIDNSDLYEIEELKKEGLIDNIIRIKTDLNEFSRIQETHKRNMLIEDIAKNECTHDLIIDSDEYYVHDTFKAAKEKIEKNDYEITYCRYVNYYHDYLHYLVYPFKEGNYVPFIAKIKYKFSWQCVDFPKPSDPTRRYVRPKTYRIDRSTNKIMIDPRTKQPVLGKYLVDYYEFPWKELKMHHFSWIRNDIRKKLNDWSSKSYFKNFDELIDKGVDRYNRFELGDKVEPAVLLFNVPGNKVDVEKFPRQFVHPKVDYHTRVHYRPNKRNIIILSMSCNLPEYKEMQETVKNTWAKDIIDGKYPNISFYFYTVSTDGKEYIDEKNHFIYVNTADNVERTYSKTIHTLELLKDKKFDFIVRTNTSTFINIPLTDEFISNIHDDSIIYTGEIESCFWSRMYFYGQGSFLIISKSITRKILNNKHLEWENKFDACDDVMIEACLNDYYLRNKLIPRNYVASVGMLYNFEKHVDYDFDKYKNILCVKLKTDIDASGKSDINTRKYDNAKMYELYNLEMEDYKSGKKFILPDLNKGKVLWLEDKEAYLNYKGDKSFKKFTENFMISYEEAVRRQKKLKI